MERTTVRRVLIGRDVFVALVLVVGAFFVPPLLTGSQLLYDSPAAPVWQLAVRTGTIIGCGSLSCIPLVLTFFAGYIYLIALVAGNLAGRAFDAVR